MRPVELIDGIAGMHPSGMGSYSYASNFRVLVKNIAYAKSVGIWGRHATTGLWYFAPGTYERQVPGNREVWRVTTGPLDQFAVKYEVGGATFWDNNGGYDYRLDVMAASSTDGTGTAVLGPAVLGISGYVDSSNHLVVTAAVKNLAYTKQVGMVYTADGGTSWLTAHGSYDRSYPPFSAPGQSPVETWRVKTIVPTGSHPAFAVFFAVNSATFWDNNFGQNYTA